MLQRVKIQNFKSFNRETIIELKASKIGFLTKENVASNTLKGLVFIGNNASGKTNALLAIRKLLDMLFADGGLNLDSDRCLFSTSEEMALEYEFAIDNSLIKYSVHYNVFKEFLIETLIVNDEEVLSRIGNSAKSNISMTEVYDEIDNDSLILREIYFNTKFRKNELLQKWFDYLINSVYINAHLNRIFSPSKRPFNIKEYLDVNGVDVINEFLGKRNFSQTIEYVDHIEEKNISYNSDDGKQIFFKRDGIDVPIPFGMESLGNQNLLKLLPVFLHSIENSCMLLIDEFSSGFHNKLEQMLIKFFMKNSVNSQLLLVTHSTNILSNSLLRPDQEVIVSFTGEDGSILRKASDEKPRQAQNVEKMYLSGVFGGLPEYEE